MNEVVRCSTSLLQVCSELINLIFLAAESNSGKKCAALALSSNRLVRIRDVRNNGRLLSETGALMIETCISIIH